MAQSIIDSHVSKLTDQVEASLKEINQEFRADRAEFRQYVTEQVLKLQAAAGQKGFQGALKRTRNNCLAKAIESTGKAVQEAEFRLTLGIIQGVLAVLV